VACGFGPIACVGAAGVLALASGGSIAAAVQAMAMSAFNIGVWSLAGDFIAASGLHGLAGELFGNLVHGAVGGGLSALRGDSFMQGFIPAFAAGVMGPVINSMGSSPLRIAASAIVGGTTSALTGGKFMNGALTAAFARMYNDEMHLRQATCAGVAGAAAAVCMGTAAASVACPATGAVCVIVPPSAAACGGAAAAAIAVCSVANGGSGISGRVHGNSADSMIGTEVYYLINNTSGDIDKIGITSYGERRYTQLFYRSENVRYVPQAQYEWRTMAVIDEQIRILRYYNENGRLPRLNNSFR
jgi:hypothetical protein